MCSISTASGLFIPKSESTLEPVTVKSAPLPKGDIKVSWFAPEGGGDSDTYVFPQFKDALELIKKNQPNHLVRTPLIEIELPACGRVGKVPRIFVKDETKQHAKSFKPRGILYDIVHQICKIVAEKPDILKGSKPFYIVTQSTGNHGAALAELGTALKVRCLQC